MSLQTEVIATLKKYCVENSMVFLRRWTPEWTINDFSEALVECIRVNEKKLSDDKLRSFIAGIIKNLETYPACADFINELKPFVTADAVKNANTHEILNITRRYREKFVFIPPVEFASGIEMQYGSNQELYMRLMMTFVDNAAKRYKEMTQDQLTFDLFLEELLLLGRERNKIALDCGHKQDDLFGEPRWNNSNSEPVSTLISGSNYIGLKKLCLEGRDPEREKDVHVEPYYLIINGEKIPVTQLKWDDKDEAVSLSHTLPQYVLPILKAAYPYWQQVMDPNCSKKNLIKALASLEYLLQHAMPFERGSAAIIGGITYALYKKHGYEIIPSKANTAIYWKALGTRSLQDFIKVYEDIFAVAPLALPEQKEKLEPRPLAAAKIAELRLLLKDLPMPESSGNTTPSWHASTQSKLIVLKQRIDAPDAAYDTYLQTQIEAYCKTENAPYRKNLEEILKPCFNRENATHKVVLWDCK